VLPASASAAPSGRRLVEIHLMPGPRSLPRALYAELLRKGQDSNHRPSDERAALCAADCPLAAQRSEVPPATEAPTVHALNAQPPPLPCGLRRTFCGEGGIRTHGGLIWAAPTVPCSA
jgi:hypothetical protein